MFCFCFFLIKLVASIARKIYLSQGIGVDGFQKIYGGHKRNGSRPPHFCKSSGAIARNILKQLQKMEIIDIHPKGRTENHFHWAARSRSSRREGSSYTLNHNNGFKYSTKQTTTNICAENSY